MLSDTWVPFFTSSGILKYVGRGGGQGGVEEVNAICIWHPLYTGPCIPKLPARLLTIDEGSDSDFNGDNALMFLIIF